MMNNNGERNFVEILLRNARERPRSLAFRFLRNGEDVANELTYGELEQVVVALAARLQERSLVGERALLLYPSGLDYVIALFACLSAGVIAVPAYPPRAARGLPRLEAIARDAGAKAVLTTAALAESLRGQAGGWLAHAEWIATDGERAGTPEAWQPPQLNADDLAYLQYTSGSTGEPKGVMVSHGNLIHNSARIAGRFAHDAESRFVSWLPLFHDLGLIFGVLQPMFVGGPCALMAPAAFLQRPFRWLKAISELRATTSGGPNFAYDLCVRKIPAALRAELELSSWRIALNGAEPVRSGTLDQFTRAFAPCGFDAMTHKPSYGLAEATLVVSCTPAESEAARMAVSPGDLEQGRVLVPQPSDQARLQVASGRPFDDQQLIIVDPDSETELADGRVGEIWVSGRSVAHGYWQRPEESERSFGATLPGRPGSRFLRTGDLGFLRDGDLYVTGRLKDLIIVRGRNLYPQDIELTAERSHPALRQSGCAAFAVEVEGEEQIAIAAELEFRHEERHEAVSDAIRRAVADEWEVPVCGVVLLAPGGLYKTSSGKVQRRLLKAHFLSGELAAVHRWSRSAGRPTRGRGEGTVSTEESLRAVLVGALGLGDGLIDAGVPLTLLGLDSLGAATVTEEIERQFGVSVPLASLFGGQTFAGLCEFIGAQPAGATSPIRRRA